MRTVRYHLVYQHPSDWHNNKGVILMRPRTSGMFQRLMAWAAVSAATEIDAVSRDGAGRGAGPRACPATPRATVCGAE